MDHIASSWPITQEQVRGLALRPACGSRGLLQSRRLSRKPRLPFAPPPQLPLTRLPEEEFADQRGPHAQALSLAAAPPFLLQVQFPPLPFVQLPKGLCGQRGLPMHAKKTPQHRAATPHLFCIHNGGGDFQSCHGLWLAYLGSQHQPASMLKWCF